MGPIVTQSTSADDNLTGAGTCGSGTGATYQGRCGYGPRQPLLVISPFAKVNYVDHTVTDQSSILRFIEDNWNLGRIGDDATDAIAGSLLGMFKFQSVPAKAVLLDPATGTVAAAANGTKAVANPKSLVTAWIEAELDGSASVNATQGPLTYQWTQTFPANKLATILGGNTANPVVIMANGPGTYQFTLTVTDSNGVQSSDYASIILQ